MNRLWRRLRQWVGLRDFVIPIEVEELPDSLEPNKLYLIGAPKQPWLAALICPCGCRAVIQLSLIRNDDPCWALTYNEDGSATLHPSIWRLKKCRSHFFVRRNEIVWTKHRR